MASTILYPPIVESTSPAIIATEESVCRIYFSLSKFNTSDDFKNAHVVIYKQNSGVNIVNKIDNNNRYRASGIILNIPVYQVTSEDNKYYIEIINDDVIDGWQLGWLYKVQIRLSPEKYDGATSQQLWLNTYSDNFSEWSNICIFKATGISSFTIPNYLFPFKEYETYPNADMESKDTVRVSAFEDLIGIYHNTDKNETLYSYKIQVTDYWDEIIIEESELLYYNDNQIRYVFKTEPTNGETYIMKIYYTTSSNYSDLISFKFQVLYYTPYATNVTLISAENDEENLMQELTSVFMEEEEGYVGLKVYCPIDASLGNSDVMIRRADSRDNFSTWTDIKNLDLGSYNSYNIREMPIIYDNTIESGVWYKYGIQSYRVYSNGKSQRGELFVMPNPIIRNFNYTFLLGQNNQQLKLQFNNSVNNYKINLNENKIHTLGERFPFIIRNGITNYKTFSLNGLISFNMDENGLFFTKEQAYKFDEVIELYNQYNENNSITYNDDIFERQFREAVIKFLYDGKVKLLKSPTEGNMLIKLTDISLTPLESLNRIIYDFSSVVNEVANNTMENYKKYELYHL